MTETKEVDQTSRDIPDPINNDQTQMKDIEMVEESPKVDKKEVDEEEKAEAEPEAEVKAEIPDNDDDEEMEELEGEDDDKNSHPSLAVATNNGVQEVHVEGLCEKRFDENIDSSCDAVENDKDLQTVNIQTNVEESDTDVPASSLKSGLVSPHKSPINDEKESIRHGNEGDNGVKLDVYDSLSHESIGDETMSRVYPVASPNPQSSPSALAHVKEGEAEDDVKLKGRPSDIEGINSSRLTMFDTDTSGGGDSGTREEQAAFMMEIHKFHKERSMDFRAPKFYGEPLNLLKLWRAVLKLGGYDKVTTCKYWRQVGESFRPPRTCTTISFTFRMFYEKALLEYEKYRTSSDAFGLLASLAVPMDPDHQTPGPGRTRRDAAARAMQGWHSQRNLDNGEVSDPIAKDKNSVPSNKKEKALKSLGGILKRKKTSSPDDAIKSAPMKLPNLHSDATVIDIGSPADWVKINVRATRDCYEVYALVPGLLREEVRVQSDPAGRLVISGEPEDPDNPWNVTPFKKVVSLPSRIDPHQTSAVVTLHGQLFVRVPFEHYD